MSKARYTSARAFTLIEMVGVLAIIAILLSMLAPRLMKRATDAQLAKEEGDIAAIGFGLTSYILKNKTVPDASTWATNVAEELSYPASAVLDVGGNTRVLLIHPDIALGSPASGTLPYIQTSTGSVAPGATARMMILSSLAGPLPVSSGKAASAAAFDEIWNVGLNEAPASWTSWSGSGETLKIVRINIASLMHQVIINDVDADAVAYYSADANPTNAVTGYDLERWFFKSTVLTLWSGGNVEYRDHLLANKSYFFENGHWRGILLQGTTESAAGNVGETTELFLNDTNWVGKFGSTSQMVVDAFYIFLINYASWASWDFENATAYDAVTDASTRLNNNTTWLINP